MNINNLPEYMKVIVEIKDGKQPKQLRGHTERLWALFAIDKKGEMQCLQVGATENKICKEINQDIKYMFLNDGRGFSDEKRTSTMGNKYRLLAEKPNEEDAVRRAKSLYRYIKENYTSKGRYLAFYSIDIDMYLGITGDTPTDNDDFNNMIRISKMNYAEGKFACENNALYWNAYKSGIDMKTFCIFDPKKN